MPVRSSPAEAARLRLLADYGVMDTGPDVALDEIVALASALCGTPIALVSLVDDTRQWFKAKVGLEAQQTPRELAFCAHAIADDGALFTVPDARQDARFQHNPLVQGDPHVVFYAGAPLVVEDGARLGTLCVIDRQPRELTPVQQQALQTLSRAVVRHLQARRDEALRAAETAFGQAVLTSIGDAVISVDMAGQVTFMNPVAQALTGWSQAEARGRPLADVFCIVDERTRAPVQGPVARALQEGASPGREQAALLLCRDSRELPIDDSAAPIRSASGAVTGVVLVFRDVTARRQAEREREAARAQAQAEKEKLHATFMQAPVGIATLEGPEHTFTFANPACRALAGGRDVVGQPLVEALPHLRGRGLEAVLDQVKRTGEPFHGLEFAVPQTEPAGEPRFLNFTYTPMRDGAGAVTGVLVSAVDVTEPVRARQRLESLAAQVRAREAELRLVMDSIPQRISFVNAQEQYVLVNRSFEEWFGLPPGELLGRTVREVVGEAAYAVLAPQVKRGLAGERLDFEQHGVRYRRGDTRDVKVSLVPHRDGDGAVAGYVTVLEDITARRRLEASEAAAQAGRRESDERLRRVVEASGAGTFDYELATGAVTASARHDALMGASAAPAPRWQVIHEADRERVARQFAAAGAGEGGGTLRSEFRVVHPDGAVRWVEVRGQRVVDAQGQARLLGTSLDVTEPKTAEQALRFEQHKLQTLFRESPAQMALWRGPELVFELVNPQYQAVFGERPLVGLPLLQALPELAQQPFPALLRGVLQTGAPAVGREVLARLSPGPGLPLQDHYFDFTYVRVDDGAGQPYGVYNHSTDVTERVESRQRLEQMDERLRLALRGGQMGTWTLRLPSPPSLDGDEAFRALHHVTAADPVQAAAELQRRLHPDDLERVAASLQVALAHGTPYACEYRVRPDGGAARWVYARGEPKFDAQGQPVSVSGVAFDIDERKRADALRERLNEQLRRSEEDFRHLAESLPDSVFVTDAAGQLTWRSRAATDAAGVPAESLRAADFWARVHPDDGAATLPRWERSLATGAPLQQEHRVRQPDGSWRWHLVRAAPSRDVHGQIVRWIGTSTDIHDQRTRQEALEQQHQFERHLVGIVSHDLRNPLSVVLMGTSTLMMIPDLPDKAKPILKRIQSSAERGVRMVRDLLDFTQARVGGGIRLDRRPTDLLKVTRSVLDEVEAAYPRRTLTLAHTGDLSGHWDADRLAQVLSNLVTNAIKYSPADTPVAVHLDGDAQQVTLAVHNVGTPIPAHRLGHIFEPMQRATDSLDHTSRSVGLGLYIVAAILRAHGGRADVVSTEFGGTTFTVCLPRQSPASA